MAYDLADGINWYVVFLFSISCHEAAHAWAASRLGDDTAKEAGQVTLDPTPHMKRAPFGTVVVPIVSYILSGSVIGWAHAPYSEEWARRWPARCALMSLAGPVANLGIAILALFLIRVGCEWGVFSVHEAPRLREMLWVPPGASGIWVFLNKILGITFQLNVLLGVFNLIPLPPLAGCKLPFFLLPKSVAESYWSLIRNPSIGWMGTYAAWKVFESVAPTVLEALSRSLYAATRI